MAAVLIPVCLAVGGVIWWLTDSAMAFAFSPPLVLFWLFTRYSVPRQGSRQQRLNCTGSKGDRWLSLGAVVVALLAAGVVSLTAGSDDAAKWTLLAILSAALAVAIFRLYRREKLKARQDEIASLDAPLHWDQGEPPPPPPPGCSR